MYARSIGHHYLSKQVSRHISGDVVQVYLSSNLSEKHQRVEEVSDDFDFGTHTKLVLVTRQSHRKIMKTISWNCWELENPPIVCELNQLVQEKKFSITFLIETKILKVQMEKVRSGIYLTNFFLVNSVGRSGSLAMLWSDNVVLEVVNFFNYYIHTKI